MARKIKKNTRKKLFGKKKTKLIGANGKQFGYKKVAMANQRGQAGSVGINNT